MNTTLIKTLITVVAAVLVPLALAFAPGNDTVLQLATGAAALLVGWMHGTPPGTAAKIQNAADSAAVSTRASILGTTVKS